MAFSPDGRRLASGSWDSTVKIWDAPRGEEEIAKFLAARRASLKRELPAWHRQQATEYEKAKQWFAAAFHLRRLLVIDPDNQSLKDRLQKAQEQLKAPE